MIVPANFTVPDAGQRRHVNSHQLLPVSRRAGGTRARCHSQAPRPAAGAFDLPRSPRSASSRDGADESDRREGQRDGRHPSTMTSRQP